MIQFSPEELKELQQINSIPDQELGKRLVSHQEIDIFNSTVEELWEQGFVVSKDNFLKLWLAFDSSPQVAITKGNILETTKVHKDSFQWKSEEELEFRKLDPGYAALVQTLLRRYGFFSTGEEGYRNAVLLTNYASSQGRQIDQNNFAQIVGNFANTPKGYRLSQLPNPDQRKAAKRWSESRRTEAPKKTPLQIAQERAAQVKGFKDPISGRDLAEIEMEKFYETHPADPEAPASAPPASDDVNPDNSYWQSRTMDYLRSIQGNLLRQEATERFGKQALNGYWKLNWLNLDEFLTRRKSGGLE